jgi:hypothetical protein
LLFAFVGPCPPGMQCRHLDGNPQNNSLGNLVWGTPQENADDRIRHGTTPRGEKNNLAKLTETQVIEIRHKLAAGGCKTDLAEEYGVGVTAIHAINTGRVWPHLPSPTGSFPISPDMRKSPLRKKGVRPRGYKCRVSDAERQARRERAAYMRQFIGKKAN